MCEAGGTLVPTANFPLGKPSRSLQAAWRVSQENLAPKVGGGSGGVLRGGGRSSGVGGTVGRGARARWGAQ